jgi:hypothetical protein
LGLSGFFVYRHSLGGGGGSLLCRNLRGWYLRRNLQEIVKPGFDIDIF